MCAFYPVGVTPSGEEIPDCVRKERLEPPIGTKTCCCIQGNQCPNPYQNSFPPQDDQNPFAPNDNDDQDPFAPNDDQDPFAPNDDPEPDYPNYLEGGLVPFSLSRPKNPLPEAIVST